ncbi:MAG TPA: UDP-N-acetylmuramoyl-L-alanyl-D-glutamate--2,6-diaminopimelate ligase [Gemmatimonadota bacterium]|nr:UDP-N-acetylmuramoyl-L-alanyl-D-glutamate--2,6-diaminopimelate ligase [Gemmatimonadota bacterium]
METFAPLTLAEVARRVGGRLRGPGETQVRGLTHDSRRVGPGDLFAAVPGFETDGHRFVDQAALAGAAAALVEHAGPWPLPAIVVEDVRQAIGPAAHAIYGDPTAGMTVVGITGTNGKTTTSFLAGAVLRARFSEVAIVGTLGLRVGDRVVATGLTTPEAPDLARRLAELAREGVEAVSMEVSSHALELGRVRGVRFAAGAFTNLSPEHLDFHHTMEAYGEAKLGFFRSLAGAGAFAVVNGDDPWGERFRAAGPEGTWRYSLEDPAAEVFAERYEAAPDGTRLVVRTPAGRFETRLGMAGRFNAANALAAASLGVGLGIEPDQVGAALGRVQKVPGRYEVYRGGSVTVVVDYAHTPLAFERILKTVRESGAQRIFCVFGCGGERDRSKRPEMARIAATLAEVVYLTIDNPRREPIEQIMEDTIVGFEGTGARWERIDDRAEAIARAVAEARPGDVVCLLGKGDEEYQWIGTTRRPFSDRARAQETLAARETAP